SSGAIPYQQRLILTLSVFVAPTEQSYMSRYRSKDGAARGYLAAAVPTRTPLSRPNTIGRNTFTPIESRAAFSTTQTPMRTSGSANCANNLAQVRRRLSPL